ncbi:hypothetical protein [Rhodococcus pyridinivorans]|uniref:hypothetical protein n=1 Tax=Rhodococcus pyridinivorans TaxID=103816 RepID=UPI003AAA886E
MSDPTTPEGRADLRQCLADGQNAEWLLCEDGRTVAEDAPEEMAKWIADAGPCTAELIVAAVNALPILLDALEKAEEKASDLFAAAVRHKLRAMGAETALDRVRAFIDDPTNRIHGEVITDPETVLVDDIYAALDGTA